MIQKLIPVLEKIDRQRRILKPMRTEQPIAEALKLQKNRNRGMLDDVNDDFCCCNCVVVMAQLFQGRHCIRKSRAQANGIRKFGGDEKSAVQILEALLITRSIEVKGAQRIMQSTLQVLVNLLIQSFQQTGSQANRDRMPSDSLEVAGTFNQQRNAGRKFDGCRIRDGSRNFADQFLGVDALSLDFAKNGTLE